MAKPIIAALRKRSDLKESVLHTAQELGHLASIYGVVRESSNRFMGQKCHCSPRTFQRHVVKLVQMRILKKTITKKLVHVQVGERRELRLRNEINVYTFTLPWKTPASSQFPMDTIATKLPKPEEREKPVGFPIAITKFCTPGNIALFDKHLSVLKNEG